MEISREKIQEILPHGPQAIVIESIQSFSENALCATAIVQDFGLFFDPHRNYIPEIALELVGQASALGSVLSRPSKAVRRGVIAKVRELSFESDEPVCNNDRLSISVRWEQVIAHVTDVKGVVRFKDNSTLARVDCTVVEIA